MRRRFTNYCEDADETEDFLAAELASPKALNFPPKRAPPRRIAKPGEEAGMAAARPSRAKAALAEIDEVEEQQPQPHQLRVILEHATLDLSHAALGEECGHVAAEELWAREGSLRAVNLGGNSMGVEGARALSAALAEIACGGGMTSLDLSGNGLEEAGVTLVLEALRRHAIANAEGNSLLAQEASAIGAAPPAEGVCSMRALKLPLRHLDLRFNALGDSAAHAIAFFLMGKRKPTTLAEKKKAEKEEESAGRGDDSSPWDQEGVGGLASLRVRHNVLRHDGVRVLAQALREGGGAPLRVLDLSNNEIGDDGAVALAEVLSNHVPEPSAAGAPTERPLGAGAEGTTGAAEESATADAQAKLLKSNETENHCTLRTLVLGSAAIGARGAVALATMLRASDTLVDLSLQWNTLGDAGATSLARVIGGGAGSNSSLRTLSLRGNSIGWRGGKALARAMRGGGDSSGGGGNSLLRSLDLGENNLGERGIVALAKALATNFCLTRLLVEGNGGDGAEEAIARFAAEMAAAVVTEQPAEPGARQHPALPKAAWSSGDMPPEHLGLFEGLLTVADARAAVDHLRRNAALHVARRRLRRDLVYELNMTGRSLEPRAAAMIFGRRETDGPLQCCDNLEALHLRDNTLGGGSAGAGSGGSARVELEVRERPEATAGVRAIVEPLLRRAADVARTMKRAYRQEHGGDDAEAEEGESGAFDDLPDARPARLHTIDLGHNGLAVDAAVVLGQLIAPDKTLTWGDGSVVHAATDIAPSGPAAVPAPAAPHQNNSVTLQSRRRISQAYHRDKELEQEEREAKMAEQAAHLAQAAVDAKAHAERMAELVVKAKEAKEAGGGGAKLQAEVAAAVEESAAALRSAAEAAEKVRAFAAPEQAVDGFIAVPQGDKGAESDRLLVLRKSTRLVPPLVSLTALDLRGNHVGATGAAVLALALKRAARRAGHGGSVQRRHHESCLMKHMHLGRPGDDGLAAGWGGVNWDGSEPGVPPVLANLTSLDLRFNGIGDEGAAHLAAALRADSAPWGGPGGGGGGGYGGGGLVSLSLAANEIGDEGVCWLADALDCTRSLEAAVSRAESPPSSPGSDSFSSAPPSPLHSPSSPITSAALPQPSRRGTYQLAVPQKVLPIARPPPPAAAPGPEFATLDLRYSRDLVKLAREESSAAKSGNGLGDATSYVEGCGGGVRLRGNRTLTALDLRDNNIGNTGAGMLLTVLENGRNRTLAAVRLAENYM